MTAAQGFLGAGDLYVARIVNGVQAAFKGPYESNKFEITTSSELKKLKSKSRGNYGNVIESVPLAQPPEFAAEFVRIDKESLTLALLGTASATTQTGAAVTDEVVAMGALDDFVALAHSGIVEGAAFVVTNSGATVTYVEGTDYAVIRSMGYIKPLTGGDIAASQSLKVDYVYGTYTGTKIRGATNAQLRCAFMFDGINLIDNTPALVNVWEAVLTSGNAFDFLADDFNKVPLKGDLKTPVSKTEPFTLETRTVAVAP